jgi:hypothetical protein
MTLHISNGGQMQSSFKKSVIWVFIFTALSFAMSVYSESHTSTATSYAPKSSLQDQRPVKIENISIDYSHAHAELMKKPDEIFVSAF